MWKKIFYSLIVALCVYACDTIEKDDRIIERPLKDDPVSDLPKRVLIEEFTGARCLNCPNAAEVITQLHETYGDRIIPVAIHAGGLAPFFKTPEGTIYYETSNKPNPPSLLIDKMASSLISGNISAWSAAVIKRLEAKVGLDITLFPIITGNKLKLFYQIDFVEKNDKNLAVLFYVIENNIINFQAMPDGSYNKTYAHQHVLRAAMNGVWGTPLQRRDGLSFEAGERFTDSLDEFELLESWNQNNCSLIGIVYERQDNETNPVKEVLQVNKIDLKKE